MEKDSKKIELRLKELEALQIMDSLSEADYDNITKLAALICGVPIALVSLLDDQRQWFKSKVGIDVSETPIEPSFCRHAIDQDEDVFIIPDATKDSRFSDNPFVCGEPNIAFYAGIPLITKNGVALGTLCVVDHKPRNLSIEQVEGLQSLAQQVVDLLELRRRSLQVELISEIIQEHNLNLDDLDQESLKQVRAHIADIKVLINDYSVNHKSNTDDLSASIFDLIDRSQQELISILEKFSFDNEVKQLIKRGYLE